MPIVDSLEIQISAGADKASKNLNLMIKQLDKVQSALSSTGLRTNNLKIDNSVIKSFSKLRSEFSLSNKSMNAFKTNTNSLVSGFGKLATRFISITAVAKGFSESITKASDSLEAFNYWENALGVVAEKAVYEWENAGYESAEAYYKSFTERAADFMGKMSGFTPDSSGMLVSTGKKSLGIDPSTLMQQQATFAQMSSSMGIASERSLKLSNALTAIGADLASIKNMNFDAVWNNMASGIVGMSRAWDKYGVNIRNVNLQQKLNELGINANIQALNQQDKALLRGIILLENTRYAWGDLAETLNTPANQFRLLSANISNLSRIIGNLFMPVVAKVLPIINGFVIALQRLFTWIGKLAGIDLSGITSGFGGGGADFSGMSDALDDADSSLESGASNAKKESNALKDAAKNAKKLRDYTLGIDELNIIKPDDEDIDYSASLDDAGGAGGLGALGDLSGIGAAFDALYDEYMKAWQKAFDEMENQAQEVADRITAFAKKVFEPIRKAWVKSGKFALDGWKKALSEITTLVKSIGSDMLEVWLQDETVTVLSDILTIIGNIGYSAGFLAENFRKAWESGETGKQILENIRNIAGVIVNNIKEMSYQTALWASELDFDYLLDKIELWTQSLTPIFDNLSGVVSDFYSQVLLPLGEWAIEEGLPDLLQVFIDFNNKVDWVSLRKSLSDFWDKLEPFAEKVGEGLILFIEDVSKVIADFANSEEFKNFLTAIGDWMEDVTAEDIATTLENIANALIIFKGALMTLAAAQTITKTLTSITSFLAFFGVGGAGGSVAGNITTISTAIKGLGSALTSLPSLTIGGALAGLGIGQEVKEEYYKKWEEENVNPVWIEDVKEKYGGFFGLIPGYTDLLKGLTQSISGIPFAISGTVGHFDALDEAMQKVSEGTIYSDAQLERMRQTYALSEEDVEMLRQSMLDTNPVLLQIANNFGLFDASAETLTQVGTGLNLMEENSISAEDALAELEELIPGMTEDAKNFFKEISEGNVSFDTFREMGTNISEGVAEGINQLDGTSVGNSMFSIITEGMANAFDMHSPARKMFPFGENIFLGVLEGFSGAFEGFNERLSQFWDSYVSPWFALEKWTELYANIRIALDNVWTDTANWWRTIAIYRWYNDDVKSWFTIEKWTFPAIREGLVSSFNSAITEIKSIWTSFAEELNSKMKIETEAITVEGKQIYAGGTITLGQIQGFANGGYVPTSYSMFMAGENGVPELLGTVGGRTAVAGGAEITGIKEAVDRASSEETALLNQAVGLLSEIVGAVREGHVISVDGREIVTVTRETEARMGYAF